MSFILDALKKSEHERKTQQDQESSGVFAPPPAVSSVTRNWIPLVVLLLSCIVLLLAILIWQRAESEVAAPQQQVGAIEPPVREAQTPVVPAAPLPDISRSVSQQQPATELLPPPAEAGREGTRLPPSPAEAVTDQDRLFSIAELPADVRRRLPPLQMALHAYNANDVSASLVQINGRLVRKGAQITDTLSVEEITVNGAVLRTDGYRFLLPRRGQ